MRGQVQAHNIQSTGDRPQALRIDIFLGAVGDNMVVRTVYFHGNCLKNSQTVAEKLCVGRGILSSPARLL